MPFILHIGIQLEIVQLYPTHSVYYVAIHDQFQLNYKLKSFYKTDLHTLNIKKEKLHLIIIVRFWSMAEMLWRSVHEYLLL